MMKRVAMHLVLASLMAGCATTTPEIRERPVQTKVVVQADRCANDVERLSELIPLAYNSYWDNGHYGGNTQEILQEIIEIHHRIYSDTRSYRAKNGGYDHLNTKDIWTLYRRARKVCNLFEELHYQTAYYVYMGSWITHEHNALATAINNRRNK